MNGTLNFDKYVSIVNPLKSTLYLCIEEQFVDLHEVNLEELMIKLELSFMRVYTLRDQSTRIPHK